MDIVKTKISELENRKVEIILSGAEREKENEESLRPWEVTLAPHFHAVGIPEVRADEK